MARAEGFPQQHHLMTPRQTLLPSPQPFSHACREPGGDVRTLGVKVNLGAVVRIDVSRERGGVGDPDFEDGDVVVGLQKVRRRPLRKGLITTKIRTIY